MSSEGGPDLFLIFETGEDQDLRRSDAIAIQVGGIYPTGEVTPCSRIQIVGIGTRRDGRRIVSIAYPDDPKIAFGGGIEVDDINPFFLVHGTGLYIRTAGDQEDMTKEAQSPKAVDSVDQTPDERPYGRGRRYN